MRPHAASPGPPGGSAALRPLPAPEGKGKAALKHRGVRGSAAAQRDRAGVSASSPTLRPFPTTASQSAFLPPRGYFTASSALLSSPGANADTCVLTQGRSRTPHLSLKPILTPKVKITIKKSNPQLTHLHPPENPSPLNTFIPTRSQEMHSAALHHPFLRANRSPRAPSSTVRPAPHAGRASPALPARRTQRAPEARHGTARADRTFRAPRGAGVAGIKRREPRGTAPGSAPGTPRPPDRRSPARPGPPLRERSAATPGLRSRRQRRRELPAAAPPRRRAPRSAVPEPRPTCCASGGLTGGGRAAERSCRGAERGRARRTGPGRAGPGGAERPPAAALRPPPRCRRRATSLA